MHHLCQIFLCIGLTMSYIDHVLVTQQMGSLIVKCNILYSNLNCVSDHLPIVTNVFLMIIDLTVMLLVWLNIKLVPNIQKP